MNLTDTMVSGRRQTQKSMLYNSSKVQEQVKQISGVGSQTVVVWRNGWERMGIDQEGTQGGFRDWK